MNTTEVVFFGHDNDIVVELSSNKVPVDLSPVTRVVVSVGVLVIDSDVDVAAFDWSMGNGLVRMTFGGLSLFKRFYSCGRIITYDASNAGGIVWTDQFNFEVR